MNFSKKIKLLYVPFLLSSIGFCALYTFLNWLLIIRLEVISVKEVIVNFGLPIVLPGILMLVYLRPKLKLLNLTTKQGKSRDDLYMIVLWIILFIPVMITQHYVSAAAGTLTELQHISQLDSLPKTKFYSIKDVYIEKNNIGAHTAFEISGKHNENFDMDIYVVVPMYDNASDTSNATAWLGLTYSKTVSNNLEEKEKEEAYQKFAEESQKEFDEADLKQFVYLARVPYSEKSEGFHEALKKCTQRTDKNETQLFVSSNEPFADRGGDTLMWVFITFGGACIIWLAMILLVDFDAEVLAAYEAGQLDANKGMKEFMYDMIPRQGFFITPIIIYLNVGIFLTMFFAGLGFMSFASEDLIAWGGNYGPLTTTGEWWRLISNTFLHGGFMHLAANMYGLLFVGIFLEPVLGRLKYVSIYLITGVIASASSLWWNDAVVSIGASGTIFGLYGVFLALLVTRVFPKEMGAGFLVSTLFFVGYNLVMGVLGNGTDNAAHIGGLVSGFIIGLALYPMLKGTIKFEEELEEDDNKIHE